jgi:hypothetical protein
MRKGGDMEREMEVQVRESVPLRDELDIGIFGRS